MPCCPLEEEEATVREGSGSQGVTQPLTGLGVGLTFLGGCARLPHSLSQPQRGFLSGWLHSTCHSVALWASSVSFLESELLSDRGGKSLGL